MIVTTTYHEKHRYTDNFRPVYFTVSAWEWMYATNLPRLQRKTKEKERETSKRNVREAHSLLMTAILLPQCLSCDYGKKKCHCACSPILDSPTCVWPLCNRNPKAKICHGLSPRANCSDRATTACRRSDCQLLRIEGATWSAWLIPTAVFSVF
jgi:hypothetical protein